MLIWVILVCLKIRLAVEILTRQWCWSFNWRFLSLCNLFILQKAIDAGLLLTTNEIRAQKDLVFAVTRRTFQLEPLDQTLRGYGISLKMAWAWQIRQTHLHQACTSEVLELNLKIDGRPLAGTVCSKSPMICCIFITIYLALLFWDVIRVFAIYTGMFMFLQPNETKKWQL